ncbi:MAG TPA: HlyD family efflux transporter periplasmic adaptor subunit [Candidatus Paceibacterota bacterium]|nr:HlyD family efflux transporter periplasmic adaptor subunit [Candidatus Paceibacterota bacterium]
MDNDQKEILQQEKEILREERVILQEVKKEEELIRKGGRRALIGAVVFGLLLIAGVGGFLWWQMSVQRVAIDRAEISAPLIDLAPATGGTLQEVFVREGDEIAQNTPVARVGDELIKSKLAGIVVTVHDDIGKMFAPGTPVVTMVDPTALRVVGHLEEDKGLASVRVGQMAVFTVDTFGSKSYYGTVDEVAPSSRQDDVVFNISNERPVNEFDIKVRFDTEQYPELKNGMSARIWIYK